MWESDVARFGIDIFMTTTALVRRSRVVQAFLGAKIHDPKDPGADLGPMFTQVVGTLLVLARQNADAWLGVTGSRDAPIVGEVVPVEPEPVNASPAILVEKFRAGAAEQRVGWAGILSDDVRSAVLGMAASGDTSALAGDLWARAVYDVVAASRARDDTESLARALLPLYFARVAALLGEVRDLDQAGAERVVEAQAASFERLRPYLVERWA